jgi:hypothetical protein
MPFLCEPQQWFERQSHNKVLSLYHTVALSSPFGLRWRRRSEPAIHDDMLESARGAHCTRVFSVACPPQIVTPTLLRVPPERDKVASCSQDVSRRLNICYQP